MPNIFDLDFQPSATPGCGWMAVGTRRNIGIMWLAPQCPEGSKGRQRATTEKVERGVACYFQSNFNLRDQAGEVSCGAFRIAVSMQYVPTYTSG